MDTFAALAEPNRRKIIELLADNGKLSATDIAKKFHLTPPAISQHLKVLREAKLVDMEKRAQQRIYTVNPATISELEEWIKKIKVQWEERLNRLETVIETLKKKKSR